MKLKIAFLIVVIGLILLSWHLWVRPATAEQIAGQSAQAAASSADTTKDTNVAKLTKDFSTNGIPEQRVKNDLERTNEFIDSIDGKNSPIVFYGKVVDQHGDPISGAKIHSTIRQWYVRSPVTLAVGAHFIPVERESDSNGRFQISGKSGDGFGVGIVKDGYQLSPKAPKGFGPTAGSFETPIVFKMWKNGISESLAGGSHVFGIDAGKVYTVDLVSGKKMEGAVLGDMRITITRPDNARPRDKYSWSFSVEFLDGGLVEPDPNDEFMYVAPESGYKPKLEAQFDPANTNWVASFKKDFFLRARNGQLYGRMQMEIYSVYNKHSAIELNYAVNQNRSRNLQP